MSHFLFKDRDGQTPLPLDLRKGLKPKNIQTIGDLDELEEQNILKGLVWMQKQDKDPFDYQFWLSLHKKLFGDVWSWAGSVREKGHELANPDFALPNNIWPSFKKLQEDLKYWQYNNTFQNQELAARLHERMLTIHPFPNGNGRFSRILTEYYCERVEEITPSWGKSLVEEPKARRSTYINSIETARKKKNYIPLMDFIFS